LPSTATPPSRHTALPRLREVPGRGRSGRVASSITMAAPQAGLSHPAARNLVMISAPSLPSTEAIPITAPQRQVVSPTTSSTSGGNGPGTTPHAPALPSHADTTSLPSAPVANTPNTTVAATPKTGTIRPMTLAPRTAAVSYDETAAAPPPLVSVSGGMNGGGTGNVQISGGASVGSVPTFTVSSSGGWSIDPATIKWSGGTDYSTYYSQDATSTVANTPELTSMRLGQAPPNNQ
jgi:hypothetical protein